ncbi:MULTISPECIES: cold-shock protein [Larkinella]|jgi:cold shock CspA family protein|uniref:Cold shock domain-containing protein n=2 Tax=Larkinella TaxID=332157 RepID=A0A5N1JJ93_9BACT|nr:MULTISPECIES: cold shock domain-containing protein [Larkinella]KAA9353423.1 cold shock domain-containing protein [Larkinella humicola]RCR68871.1 cold shock domain-containing protein [Larkinella punicea]
MGRTQETFNKKEKEKNRQKKNKEKAEKKEERKANSDKGKGLDEMMAYVDENGNISSSPPDLRKKKTINTEDIQIGVSRQEPGVPQEVIRKGTVTFFNESKGYGFIKDQETQDSVFVHISGLVDAVKDGDKVTFEVEMTAKGPNARDVKKAV